MDYYIDTFPGREIIINQKTYLYFGGTSYLGLQTDSAYKDLFIKNVKKYGTNYGASRKSNIRLSIYEEAESYLANWTGSEACLTLSSGYLAGQLVSGYFNTDQYKPFYAPNSHPALFGSGGGRAGAGSYTTYTSLEAALRKHLDKNVGIVPVVFLDSIDISGANYPDFKGIHSLPLKDIIIVADDSHGIGVVGKRGAGVFSILKDLEPAELIVCYSLGKALGIQGGAVLGTSKRIEDLKMTDFFGGASPVAPAYLATLIQGEDIIRRKRELLMEYMDLFTAKIGDLAKINKMPEHPAYSYSDTLLTTRLEESGVMITDFSYPNAEASPGSRIVLSAGHERQDITYLAKVLTGYFSG